MASLYKRNINGCASPFWWLKWRNPATGKIERLSTECRIGDGVDHARAVQIRNEHAVKESAHTSAIRKHPFFGWVSDYLATTHSDSPRTLTRYQSTWDAIAEFLHGRDIVAPTQVRRQHALEYFAHRVNQRHLGRNKTKIVSRNTVILELKVLSKIMNEAVARDYIEYNPITRLHLKRAPARPKEEMSDAQIQIVREEIKRLAARATTKEEKENADFLNISFEIARLQGIRLNETRIALDDVDLDAGTLMIMGKGRKLEQVNLNPNLTPLFRRLKQEDRTHTYKRVEFASLKWFKLFDDIRSKHPGFKNISFHSTRVTVISRMERAGVPENVMMKTVLHSSATVHRVYRKVKPSELEPYWKSVGPSSS